MIEAYTAGSFVFCVQMSGGKHYYAVKNFVLNKSVGALTSCKISLMDITWQVNIRQSSYPQLSLLSQLYQTACNPQTKPMKCQLLQYNSRENDGKPQQWFTGRVCAVTPVIAERQGIISQYTCFCMSKACQLMFSYVHDYKYVDAQAARNIPQLQRNGIIGANAQATNIFSTNKLNISELISNSSQSIQSDNIAQLFAKPFTYLQQMSKKLFSINQGVGADIDLLEYLTSDYRVSRAVAEVIKAHVDLGHNNPYLTAFDQAFASGIDNRTLLDAVLNTLAGQRFLTVVPAQRGIQDSEDKLRIIPSYVLPVQDATPDLYPQDIEAVQVAANPLGNLSIPDKLFVNLTMMSAFDMGSDVMQDTNAIYGEFASVSDDKIQKIKQAGAPWWLLTLAVQKARFNTHKESMKNFEIGQSTADAPKMSTDWMSEAKKLFDSYAKTLYFAMYASQKSADIRLLPTSKARNLDKYLGKSLGLQLPLDQENLNKKSYSFFYGVLTSVSYEFGCSTSPQTPSYLNISAHVTALTPQSSDFTDIMFMESGDVLLYEKTTATQ